MRSVLMDNYAAGQLHLVFQENGEQVTHDWFERADRAIGELPCEWIDREITELELRTIIVGRISAREIPSAVLEFDDLHITPTVIARKLGVKVAKVLGEPQVPGAPYREHTILSWPEVASFCADHGFQAVDARDPDEVPS